MDRPITSCPSRASRAAATEESTPPDIATTMRISLLSTPDERSKFLDRRRKLRDQLIDFSLRVSGAEAEADRVLRAVRRQAHRAEHVRRLQCAGRAGGARRDGEALEIERDEQRLRLDAVEADVGRVRHARASAAVHNGAGDALED